MARKIYLVEDEKSLNILLEKYLQRGNYEVTTFFNGSYTIRVDGNLGFYQWHLL